MTPAFAAPSGGYLTTGEAATRIGSTPQHVRRLIASGLLAAIDIAANGERPCFRIAEAAIATYLREAAYKPGDRPTGGAIRIPESVLSADAPTPSNEVA